MKISDYSKKIFDSTIKIFDSNMKISVIGQEGAGKTVFLAMLNYYAAQESSGMVFDSENIESSMYIAQTLEVLGKQKWPMSTLQGSMRVLKWRLGMRGKKSHQIKTLDPAGQDIKKILLNDDLKDLEEHLQPLRKDIEDSDKLIYLLDMSSLIESGDSETDVTNAWLLRAFLKRPEWCSKQRILVISKADKYKGLIEKADGDLKKMIANHWPPAISSPDVLLSQLKKIECFAVTSVKAITHISDEGNPVLKPMIPLESDGFKSLIEYILLGKRPNPLVPTLSDVTSHFAKDILRKFGC
jgi:energy-coupling factor transporter ATP-binding protein EcfA2